MFAKFFKYASPVWLLVGLSACGDLKTSSGQPVSIAASPMAVHTSYFKDKKSKDFSSLDQSVMKDPNFDAFTIWFFHCFADFQTEEEKRDDTAGACTVRLKVKAVQIRLSCPVTIWLAEDAPLLVREHEKGHVYICKRIYEHAPKVARDAASSVIGQIYNGMGSTPAAARQMAIAQAERDIAQIFRDNIVNLGDEISTNYDQLCYRERGNNPHAEKLQQALAEKACQRLEEHAGKVL
ncbi:hypothetical protein BH11CYA1_BH11CYA1_48130 [soil metagenome]